MKIVIGSDSHDNLNNLEKVIEVANEKGCEYFLFAGDFISPFGLEKFAEFKGRVEMVWGNNEGEKVGFMNKVAKMDNVKMHGNTYEDEIDSVKIFMCHYPNIIEMATRSGEYDIAIHGHTHLFRKEKRGNTLIINPGNIGGHLYPASFVVFDTESREVERVEI